MVTNKYTSAWMTQTECSNISDSISPCITYIILLLPLICCISDKSTGNAYISGTHISTSYSKSAQKIIYQNKFTREPDKHVSTTTPPFCHKFEKEAHKNINQEL
jgi:hypothetical protein